jgi:arginine decarboxylase
MRPRTVFHQQQRGIRVEGKSPDKIFLTHGVGRHKEKLTSFELALRSAGIAQFNLVHVSSIFPPHCVIIPRTRGISMMRSGEIVYCVLSQNSTNEQSRLVGAGIGVAIPTDRKKYGYISEHHAFGMRRAEMGDYTEDLAATMLASTLGIEIDLSRAWNERKQEWKIAGQIVRTTNITQTALGKEGMWTSVFAAAVFCSYKSR